MKFKDYINEEFTNWEITVEKSQSNYSPTMSMKEKTLEKETFKTEKEAKIFKKKMIKKYKLIKWAGRYATKDAQIELSQNF